MKNLDNVQDENYVPEYANSNELQDWIFNNLSEGSKILEFGSGTGTIELAEQYDVTSVEDNEEWLYLAQDSTYIYAPLVNDWYDWQALDILKNETFDLILIDGPYDLTKRTGVFDWFQANPKVFSNAILMIDDNAMESTIELPALFKDAGWEQIHQGLSAPIIEKQNFSQLEPHFGVYVQNHECPECGEEFNRSDDMIECCANL